MADTSTVGGVISGYWATGRLKTATPPASVTRMDSTVAKIGRSMKNRVNVPNELTPLRSLTLPARLLPNHLRRHPPHPVPGPQAHPPRQRRHELQPQHVEPRLRHPLEPPRPEHPAGRQPVHQ